MDLRHRPLLFRRSYGAQVDAAEQAQVLAELRDVAAVRRAARRHIADVTAEHGRRSPEHATAWTAYKDVNHHWAELIRRAAAAGHTLADIARAAGCARPSLYSHLNS